MHDDASAEILKLCSERIVRLFRVCVSMSTAKLLPEFMIAAAHFANIARVMFRRRMNAVTMGLTFIHSNSY